MQMQTNEGVSSNPAKPCYEVILYSEHSVLL